MGPDAVAASIREAFADVPYPGDDFLQGSFEGSEPAEVAAAYRTRPDWRDADGAFLDAAGGLSFLSEGAFRFYMPAFLLADVASELETEDPVFHLTSPFFDRSVDVPSSSGTHARPIGGSSFVNPRRYGAMTWTDHGRSRLSVFTREEAGAIVAYLELQRRDDSRAFDHPAIDAALERFWRDRAERAPTAADLARFLEDEAAYLSTLID